MLLLLFFLNNVAVSPTYIVNVITKKNVKNKIEIWQCGCYSVPVGLALQGTYRRETGREWISIHVRCNVCLKTLRSSLGLKEHTSDVRG